MDSKIDMPTNVTGGKKPGEKAAKKTGGKKSGKGKTNGKGESASVVDANADADALAAAVAPDAITVDVSPELLAAAAKASAEVEKDSEKKENPDVVKGVHKDAWDMPHDLTDGEKEGKLTTTDTKVGYFTLKNGIRVYVPVRIDEHGNKVVTEEGLAEALRKQNLIGLPMGKMTWTDVAKVTGIGTGIFALGTLLGYAIFGGSSSSVTVNTQTPATASV